MITFNQSGDFGRTMEFFNKAKGLRLSDLDTYGNQGVMALSKMTPVDSGLTSDSWSYKISREKGKTTITWYNSNSSSNVPIAIILQYGHGTKNGGWVAGRDYINPAMRPVFDKMADLAWKEVTNI